MKYTYYHDPRSGSCRRVSAVIKHLGLNIQTIFVDLLSGGSQTPEFLSISPAGMVPALVLTDQETGHSRTISEASAIMIYLCEHFDGGAALYPTGPEREETLKWMFWAAEHFRQPAPMYFEEKVIAPIMGATANAARLKQADKILARHAPVLDAHLKNRDFVVGNSVTLADFDLAAPLSHMDRTGSAYSNYPNIVRWEHKLNQAIPAWKFTGKQLNDELNKSLDQ